MIKLSRMFHFIFKFHIVVLQPHKCRNKCGLGCSLFARHYLGNHYCFLFLRVLRCFSSPGQPPFGWYFFKIPGFPIRTFLDQQLFAPPQDFSQLVTSFIASESQGIHLTLLLTFLSNSIYYYSRILSSCQRTCLPLSANLFRVYILLRAIVENIGVEPMTSCVQGRRSSQLS